MSSEENIRKQYQEYEGRFNKIRDDLEETLYRLAKTFFQKTRFKVVIPSPRLKTIDSIISKISRKGVVSDSLFKKENENEIIPVVNDFLGARISCNTTEDVKEIAGLLKQHRRFKLIKEDLRDKESGYRALHLDMYFQVHLDDDLVFIPVELQIKTHLQTAWGDITHDESYKPVSEDFNNEWEFQYSKHMADMLDTLDKMAVTIRRQRLAVVNPPLAIDDSNTIINAKTLSYKVNQFKTGARLTQQDMTSTLRRLKEEGFETLAEIKEILEDSSIERSIKTFKEQLRNNENVSPYEMLYYGSLLKRGNVTKFRVEMSQDYGFVEMPCPDCERLLTNDEYIFMKEKTDTDVNYYCVDHRLEHFPNKCPNCSTYTSGLLCKTCDAEVSAF